MRQTMFNSSGNNGQNNNFMTKLRSSNAGTTQYEINQLLNQTDRDAFGGNNRIGTTNSNVHNQAQIFNLVNQRKTPNANQQQMMMTTQFFNST